jgi:subtilisin family serine protease
MAVVSLLLLNLPTAGADAGEARYYVARFRSVITDSSRTMLERTGATIIDYEPADAYIVWASSSQARAAGTLEVMRSVEALSPARKVEPGLLHSASALVEVGVHSSARRRVASILGSPRALPVPGRDLTALTGVASEADIRRIAWDPGVLYVQQAVTDLRSLDESTAQIAAGNLNTAGTAPVTGYPAWLAGLGLDGSGVTVAVTDTGISQLHPDVDDRVASRIDYSGTGSKDEEGHGTHVAGIIAGAPSGSTAIADPSGFLYGQGIAPGARLLDQKIFGQVVLTFPTLSTMAADARGAGASIMNGSWAFLDANRAGYGPMVREVDQLSRDSRPQVAGQDEFLFVLAAGNQGAAGPPIPQEAKNIVTVGATGSGRPTPVPLQQGQGGINDVWGRSARGPAADGRIYPTIVAPGADVVSARSPEGIFGCLPPPADGLGLYTYCSGTSMAAPHVSGAAALIHQWWMRETGSVPSPAMVRALLVNSATDIGSPNIPNNDEGWGRLNMRRLFAEPPSAALDQKTVLAEPGDRTSVDVVSTGDRPLRVTVAWSDAPAAVGANPALVNDLDLEIVRLDPSGEPIERWLGNMFDGGRSVQGDSADRLNNLENVFLFQPEAGTYRITVRAANVPGDGIPGNEDATDQDFALVVRGTS